MEHCIGVASPFSNAINVCGILDVDAGENRCCARSSLLIQVCPSDSRLTTTVVCSIGLPDA